MNWLTEMLGKFPELAVFLAVGVGYAVGNLKFKGIGLGSVTGSLLAGCLIGYFFHIPVSSTAKSILFLLFLFGIGYSVGPQFFKAMRGDGLRWAALSAFMCVAGLLAAWAVARYLALDPGFAAGLLSGALTESPAIGTATEAINALPLAEAERARLIAHIAVADAVCYIFGAVGVILFCSVVAPRLLGINLEEAARRIEAELGIDRREAGVISGWRAFELRAYRVEADSSVVGRTVAEAEQVVPDARIFIERLRRGDRLIEPVGTLRIETGDVLVVAARREILAEVIGRAGVEVDDRAALDMPVASFDVFVTSAAVAGKTLGELEQSDLPVRSVFLRAVRRRGLELPVAPGLRIERGDVLRLAGTEPAVKRAAAAIGITVRPTDSTDFVTLGLGIFIGALLGAAISIPVGGLRISIGTSVGTLLAGLVVGHLHSLKPWFGSIPDGAVQLMTSLGLAAFVAMIGLGAGPHFVEGLRSAGLGLFFGGIVVTSVPLLAGLYFGRYVLKLDPLQLLGGIAGAQTMTAGLAAVQEKSGSTVAVLGYSGTVAPSHILLTTWGTVIVWLVS